MLINIINLKKQKLMLYIQYNKDKTIMVSMYNK